MDCADNPRILVQSSDPNFAQDNPRFVPIQTLHITYISEMQATTTPSVVLNWSIDLLKYEMQFLQVSRIHL